MLNLVPLKRRKNAYGVGILDVDYDVAPAGGDLCPFYSRWRSVLMRCYYPEHHRKHPSYIKCTVCSEWMRLSKFKKWMQSQNWQGMDLDKDIIKYGNKVYCPEYCRFVTPETNGWASGTVGRGSLPIGITMSGKKYHAQCNLNGVTLSLGDFHSFSQASAAYLEVKMLDFERVIAVQTDEGVVAGLVAIAERIISEHEEFQCKSYPSIAL